MSTEMTDDDRRIAQEYTALDQEGKDAYLEKNGVVILDMEANEDGSVNWKMDLSDRYYDALEGYRTEKNLETIDDAFIDMLTTYSKKVIEEYDAKKTD